MHVRGKVPRTGSAFLAPKATAEGLAAKAFADGDVNLAVLEQRKGRKWVEVFRSPPATAGMHDPATWLDARY